MVRGVTKTRDGLAPAAPPGLVIRGVSAVNRGFQRWRFGRQAPTTGAATEEPVLDEEERTPLNDAAPDDATSVSKTDAPKIWLRRGAKAGLFGSAFATVYACASVAFKWSAMQAGGGSPFELWPNMSQDAERVKVDTPHWVRLAEELTSKRQANIALCTFDAVQSASYLGQAAIAIRSASKMCDSESAAACSSTVSGVFLSFMWVASYLSEAANVCGTTANAQAWCATDATCLVANLGDIASASSAFAAGTCTNPSTAVEFTGVMSDNDRKAELANCVFDTLQATTYLGKAGLAISAATADCLSDQKTCSVDILNLVSSFSWAAQFLALAVSDCPYGNSAAAACAAAITDLLAAVNSEGACATDISTACSLETLNS